MTTSDDKKHERVKITWEQKQLTKRVRINNNKKSRNDNKERKIT